jgi:type IV pilus assembly protein PilZ
MSAGFGARSGILTLTIKDKAVLYAAYMPFIKNGGLFIPTAKNYQLGDEVFLLLNLMDEPDKIPVAGKVVWVTPKGAQGNRAAGIGVKFNEEDETARNTCQRANFDISIRLTFVYKVPLPLFIYSSLS